MMGARKPPDELDIIRDDAHHRNGVCGGEPARPWRVLIVDDDARKNHATLFAPRTSGSTVTLHFVHA